MKKLLVILLHEMEDDAEPVVDSAAMRQSWDGCAPKLVAILVWRLSSSSLIVLRTDSI